MDIITARDEISRFLARFHADLPAPPTCISRIGIAKCERAASRDIGLGCPGRAYHDSARLTSAHAPAGIIIRENDDACRRRSGGRGDRGERPTAYQTGRMHRPAVTLGVIAVGAGRPESIR